MDIRTFYQASAGRFPEGLLPTGRVRMSGELFAKHLGHAERLLDIGCGHGETALYLAGVLGARDIYGVEITDAYADEARDRGLETVVLDIGTETLPFDDSSMDAVFCGEVLEHVLDTDHLVEEIYRVLRPRGVAVLTTPNLAGWYDRFALLLGYQPFPTAVSFHRPVGRPRFMRNWGVLPGGHIRVFTFAALREFLRSHGFEVLQARGVGFLDTQQEVKWPLPMKVVGKFDGLVSRFPSLAGDVAVAMTKGRRG